MLVMKMPPKKRRKRSFESLIFLLVFGLKMCDSQMSTEEDDDSPTAEHGSHSAAFFALRSCHQILGGDSGEFFSPDYLCSNPPLWCNWTIRVHPGKRIHLQLDDLGPDDTCHWRRDQIHVDEPEGQRSSKHSVLQKCWREAAYTSTSNTVHVVLLIEGSPTPTYRGFHGRYQAFGPPQAYNPQDVEYSPNESLAVTSEPFYDYYEESDTNSQTEEETNEDEEDETLDSDSEIPVRFIERSTEEPEEPKPSLRVFTAIRRNVAETEAADVEMTDQSEEEIFSQSKDEGRGQIDDGTVETLEDEDWTEEAETSKQNPPASKREIKKDITEPQFDTRADTRAHVKYHNQSPHLPGDLLLEVSVEVNVSRDSGAPWNDVAQSLLLSVKTLVRDQLKSTLVSQSISSKRIKRLNAGVLFILWLQTGQSSGHHAHEVVHSSLQRLIGSGLRFRENHVDSVIMSLSTADVNECDTQLVVCDPNADCVNHFGSYTCHCREGFQDKSRSGTGIVCLDLENTGCSASLSSEAKAVYILFFLLSALVLSLLIVFALFYHRHRRGHFFVPPSDPNNNFGHHEDLDLPPPPPPRCPPVDLQLLRYNTLLPHESKA